MTQHEHRHNCTHRANFSLTCHGFDRLLERSGARCEICRMDREEAKSFRWYLGLDHDHKAGWFAIRGLLCQGCNNNLRWVDNGYRPPTTAESRYLADPFWRSLTFDEFTKKGQDQVRGSMFWAWVEGHTSGTDRIVDLFDKAGVAHAVSVAGKQRG